MRSPDQHRQLRSLCNLREVRKRQAALLLQQAQAALQTARQALEQTNQDLKALDLERTRLADTHRGLTERAGLLTLRRRASSIEMRRIHLTLYRMQHEENIVEAEQDVDQAKKALSSAQHRRDKLDHVARLWRRESSLDMHRQQDMET